MKRSEASADPFGQPPRPAPDRGPETAGGSDVAAGSGLAAVLARAARDILSDRGEWSADALSRSEVEQQLEHLCAVLEQGRVDRLRPGGNAAAVELQRRLLRLLRRGVLSLDTDLSAETMLTLARRMEEVGAALEPGGQQAVLSLLTGMSGRELVVELAHDLRSPLTSIMFLAETLRKGQSGEINDVQRQQLGIIYSASLNLVSVASDLIDLAREGDFVSQEQEPEPFSLGETLESVRAMVAPMAHEKRLHLHFYSPDRDVRLGSGVRLSRVLLNLTANAIKFTETGRVEILAVERGPSRVEFSVRDTGRGMDEETLASLFQPFRRSESQTGFHFSGTGLGLTICRRLVEVMGGTLQVESRPGYGSRFFFELELPRPPKV